MFQLVRRAMAKVMCCLGKHCMQLKSMSPNPGLECMWCGKYLPWLPSRACLLKQRNGRV